MVSRFYEGDDCPNCGNTENLKVISGADGKAWRTLGNTHFNRMCEKCWCVWMKVKKK